MIIKQKDKPIFIRNRLLLIIYFITAVTCSGYIAYILKDYKIFRAISAIIAIVFFWLGYGRAHYKVFKNTTFDNPKDSLKGFLFFLLFLIIFLIVFGKYFLSYFRH